MSATSTNTTSINMRELSRNTKSVIEEVVRSGRPAIVTFRGRPQVAVTSLVAPVEVAEPHVLDDAPVDVQEAIRAAEADLIAGRATLVSDSVFENLAEEEEPNIEETLEALAGPLAALEATIRSVAGKPDAVSDVREALFHTHVFVLGLPAGDTSAPGRGTESNIVTYSMVDDGRSAVLMPVFTNVEALRSALTSKAEWQSLSVLQVSGNALVENVDPDVTLVIDPWSDLEFHVPPMESRRLVVEQPIVAAAELVGAA
jgi:prevent-host-death family protein